MHLVVWDKQTQKKCFRSYVHYFDKEVAKKVNRVLHEVRTRGDLALRRYTREFDHVDLPLKKLRVSEGDVNRAFEKVDVQFPSLLKQITENAKTFYGKELRKSFQVRTKDGVFLAKRYHPLQRVGVYIPAGTAPLVSTVYMTVIPAKVAGVREIAIATPPNRDTADIDPHILVVASLLGVTEIYRMGGAQAIGAFAFGTRTVAKVEKIVGPGNPYVTEAKRQVYGFVDVDMVAGPSEIAILADSTADPDFVTCDLLAQTEHYGGIAYLITNSRKLADTMRRRMDRGTIILVKSLTEACQVVNDLAPEHLEIMTQKPTRLLNHIRNAGALFIGPYSPAVVGDYVAGPSHVLPTGGTAGYFSPLSAQTFMKSSQVIAYTKEALEKTREAVRKLTEIEGLVLHRISLEARFNEKDENQQTKDAENHEIIKKG